MTGLAWVKGCDLCNVGICDEMRARVESGDSERSAARAIAEESNAYIGEEIYSIDAILSRFRYYAGRKKTQGAETETAPTVHPLTPPDETTTPDPPPMPEETPPPDPPPMPGPAGRDLTSVELADRAIEIVDRISDLADDPDRRESLVRIGVHVNDIFKNVV